MRIDKLRIKNFRCFEHLELPLNKNLNILVGINGAGKSTVLDALAVALGGYLSGFDDIKGNNIQTEDAHFKRGAVLNGRDNFLWKYMQREKCRAALQKK